MATDFEHDRLGFGSRSWWQVSETGQLSIRAVGRVNSRCGWVETDQVEAENGGIFDWSELEVFGEFNIINNEIVYANQLKIVKRSKLEAVVKHSYFKGPYYLVEAVLNGNVLFFENQFKLEKNAIVYIDIFK